MHMPGSNLHKDIVTHDTEDAQDMCYRMVKTHRMPYLDDESFSAKELLMRSCFAQRDLQVGVRQAEGLAGPRLAARPGIACIFAML